ncbi:MAG: acetoacetate--CoA ligase [Spirochaetota bacterium]|nr:acetoacetate--CoA ligase [Spirochaetota bacterium]
MDVPIWQPSNDRIKNANITKYVEFLKSREKINLSDYESLHLWSIQNPEPFWKSIWEFCEIIGEFNPKNILTNKYKMPGATWFSDAKLNFAQNLLKRTDAAYAIIERGEHGQYKTLTYNQLYKKVAELSSSMKRIGVRKGDHIAGFMPNITETVIAMLATTSLGAVWSSCSPDFGLDGVIDRFGQIKPKMLFATNGYYYNGKLISTIDRVKSISKMLSELEYTVIIDYVNEIRENIPDKKIVYYSDFIDSNATEIAFEPTLFNDPLYIMFSSGTTGIPKCIVHGVGGTLLQHLKELILHTDLKRSDIIFYYTTCGWMMWNWMVSSLCVGATVVLYDGSPFYPNKEKLFDIIDNDNITIFGTSAKYISACEKGNLTPIKTHKLANLRTILSTGSPLSHESFDYVYQKIKRDLCLSSISGGTDIVSCFALGCPVLPVYRGELQCIGLGMNVSFYDDNSKDLVSVKGELVCKSPFPSMPTGFFNDPTDKKYHSAYFEKFNDVWAHGDYGEIIIHEKSNDTPFQRGVIIHGRSDAALNPGGVRIGTGEIYRQVEKLEEILESVVIGQDWDNDTRIVLFIKLRDHLTLTDELKQRIKQVIRNNESPKHVPNKIIQVKDIPKTISGKIVELAVKNTVNNKLVKNKDALTNPEALEYFKDLEELKY